MDDSLHFNAQPNDPYSFLNAQTMLPGRPTPNLLRSHFMGVGTWAWGDRKFWYEEKETALKEAAVEDAFKRSVELGVTMFDTAARYGHGDSERLLGKFLKKLNVLERQNIVIATKYSPLPWHINCRRELIRSLKQSLERLGMEKVDLFQIHGPALSIRSIEHLSHGLGDAYEAGLCRSVGVCNFSVDEVKRAHQTLLKRNISLSSNQVEFSLLKMRPEHDGLLATCAELGITVMAYSPLAMGRLSGKYSASNPPPRGRRFGNVAIHEIDPLIKKMKYIAVLRGKSVAQVAINWCICKGTLPIPGVKNANQAEENAGAVGWKLTPEDVQELDKLGRRGKNMFFWQHG